MQGANRLSKQLTTSKRQRMTEAHVSTPMGGWNPDAPDSTRPLADFFEMRNMRKMSADSAETRTGYKQWKFKCAVTTTVPDTGTHIRPKLPLAQCEYRYNDTFVNVAIYAEPIGDENGKFAIYALILHQDMEPYFAFGTGTSDGNVTFTDPDAQFNHSLDGHTFKFNGAPFIVTVVDAHTLTLNAVLAAGPTYTYQDQNPEAVSPSEIDLSINPAFPQDNPLAQVVHIVNCTTVRPVAPAVNGRSEFPIPVVAVRQYQTFIVVSIVDDAESDLSLGDYVYGIFPANKQLNAWTVVPIGKEVCPVPSVVDFSKTITGKLLAYIPTGASLDDQTKNTNFNTTRQTWPNGYQLDGVNGGNLTVALDLKAPCTLADGGVTNAFDALWRRNKKDPVGGDLTGTDHLKSRGWQYRFRFKRKFKDVRGNEIIVVSSPSTDIYVEDRIYCPPLMVEGVKVNGSYVFPGGIIEEFGSIPPRYLIDNSNLGVSITLPLSPSTDYQTLRLNFLAAFGPITDVNSPYFFLAASLAAAGQPGGGTPNTIVFYSAQAYLDELAGSPVNPEHAPYKLDPTSFEISDAPNAIFHWSDFTGIPSDAYAIDVYRTAYCYPDPKESDTKGTGYSPYVYGYVGTIAPATAIGGGTFVDNIQDTAILFEQSPLQSEGYLVGQFAGEVMRQYQTHMVLGNTREKYWLKTPWPSLVDGHTGGIQSFSYLDAGSGGYNTDDFEIGGADGLPLHQWYYAYSDTNKKLSDASMIATTHILANGQSVAFLFPRGYSVSIDSVLLVHSIWQYVLDNQGTDMTIDATGLIATSPTASFTSALIGRVVVINHVARLIAGQTSTTLTLSAPMPPEMLPPHGGPFSYYTPVPGSGARHYYKEAFVGVADGIYFSHSFTAPGLGEILAPTNAALTTLPLKDITVSTDPGFIIWSKPSELWSWPPENISDLHDQDPVTALDEVIGPLYVYSDKGEVMTREGNDGAFEYVEPVHTSGTGAGSISRLATCKIGAIVYSLCSNGLIITTGSGVVPFPATISQEIMKRLREKFKNRPALHGVRNRVSMGFLPNRSELWISFASTIEGDEYGFSRDSQDLPGLPARTFVLKFFERPSYYENMSMRTGTPAEDKGGTFAYEFEMCAATDGTMPNPTSIVIHTTHADGSLFSAFYDKGDPFAPNPSHVRLPALIIQDNDRPELPWPGYAALQWQSGMGMPNVMKMLFSCRVTADVHCDLFLGRGMLRTDTTHDPLTGTLWPTTPLRQIAVLGTGERAEYNIPFGGDLTERAGTPPAIRFVTRTNSDNTHKLLMEHLDVYYGPMHQHKP